MGGATPTDAAADPVGREALERVKQLAEQCGLLGALSSAIADGYADGNPAPAQRALVANLREGVKSDAERIINERGRWDSDIAAIYQRALAEAHLRGSAAVGQADGADLESLCKGWVQPSTFR